MSTFILFLNPLSISKVWIILKENLGLWKCIKQLLIKTCYHFKIIFKTYLSLLKNNIIKTLKKSVSFLTGHCTCMCCLVLQMYKKTNLHSENYSDGEW